MLIKKERDIDIPVPPVEEERESDIYLLSTISKNIDSIPGLHFVLSGSYAVEALTKTKLQHDDIDVNIFSIDLSQDLPKVAALIDETYNNLLYTYKKTNDRLEYDVKKTSRQTVYKKLEFQFVEITHVSNNNHLEFMIKSERKKLIRVPTILASLRDSNSKDFIFRVKSLPYVIATWAIRISGFADNPKRPVRDSDLEQFKLLLVSDYSKEEVISVMKFHPQMPEGKSENYIFEQALAILTRKL